MNTRNIFLIGLAATSVALAGCATSPSNGGYSNGGYNSSGYNSSSAQCYDCGTVTRIDLVRASTGGPAGAILGGIVGAVAGHEISAHTGGSKGNQNAAAAVGAVGGAVAGNAIQKRTGDMYDVFVRMDDGRELRLRQSDLGGIREGSYVRVYDGRAVLR